ncbi:MAG: PaaI family thioesterase [Rhodobacteraceae bacterium]|nr:PaaI family thioesterase [Paracoccaceae bacterium]
MTDLNPDLIEPPYPLQAHLGFTITGWEQDFARFELPLTPPLMNRYGIPHGGIYAVLLDTVMGFSGSYTGDPERKVLAMTLSLNTNFLSRPVGEILIGEGRRTGGGKSTFFSEGIIRDETGLTVATGTGVFRYRKGG